MYLEGQRGLQINLNEVIYGVLVMYREKQMSSHPLPNLQFSI